MIQYLKQPLVYKLAFIHFLVITISNYLVTFPLDLNLVKLTWAAFVFPIVILLTDLTIRLLGKEIARSVIVLTYPFAILSSICVVYLHSSDIHLAMRIGMASATAYAIGSFFDIFIFQWVRETLTKDWWPAPALSTAIASIIDTYVFFSIAFYSSSDIFMSKNWIDLATGQLFVKLCIGLFMFIPLYGILLAYTLKVINTKNNAGLAQ